MSAYVLFRFKCEKDKNSVPIDGPEIGVRQLRDRIAEMKGLKDDGLQKKKGPNPNYTLIIMDEANQELDDDNLVSAGTTVIVKRVQTSRPTTIPATDSKPQNVSQPTTRITSEDSIAAQLAKHILTGYMPSFLVCPVCKKRFTDPYISSCCNYTACHSCFKEDSCPNCQKPPNLFPDRQLQCFMLSIEEKLAQLHSQSSGIIDVLKNPKYFLVQVYDPDKLELSLNTSEWPVSPDYSFKLNTAYQEGHNVIVIFTNSEAKMFHGFGLMMSPVMHDYNETWKTRDIIGIKWLRRTEVSFSHLEELQHAINRTSLTQPIEEIPVNTGFDLCLLLEQGEKKDIPSYKPREMELEEPKREETPLKRSRSPEEKRKKSPRRKSPPKSKRSPSPQKDKPRKLRR